MGDKHKEEKDEKEDKDKKDKGERKKATTKTAETGEKRRTKRRRRRRKRKRKAMKATTMATKMRILHLPLAKMRTECDNGPFMYGQGFGRGPFSSCCHPAKFLCYCVVALLI